MAFFFHGTEVLGLVGGLGLGFVGSILIVLRLLYTPPKNALWPVAAFVVVAIPISAWYLLFSDGLGFTFAIALGFPWTLILVFLATFMDLNFGEWGLVAGSLMNAVAILLIGSFAKRSLNSEEGSH